MNLAQTLPGLSLIGDPAGHPRQEPQRQQGEDGPASGGIVTRILRFLTPRVTAQQAGNIAPYRLPPAHEA